MYFLYSKNKNSIILTASKVKIITDYLENNNLDVNQYEILTRYDEMKNYISRIVYVEKDGVKTCIYNNKNFWTSTVFDVLNDFENYKLYDFLDNEVTNKKRLEIEADKNYTRVSAIDGLAGEVEYNITVGNEFISLFREECVKTDFKTITPLQIAQKLSAVIGLVQTGSFREAKQVLQTIENDDFLTPERVSKYIAMMESADAIEYATDEDFFYTASNNT